jgi:carbon monoxide dehydrogenase subunit G
MQLVSTFIVGADPETTYAFLLDVNQVASCVPGVSSVEATGIDAFTGTLKVKVGPIGVTYRGAATITSRDPATHTATITADGTEGVGAGRVHAVAVMEVIPHASGSQVTITADLEIAGRLAQFGRGIIDGVAKRIVKDMAKCIETRLDVARD